MCLYTCPWVEWNTCIIWSTLETICKRALSKILNLVTWYIPCLYMFPGWSLGHYHASTESRWCVSLECAHGLRLTHCYTLFIIAKIFEEKEQLYLLTITLQIHCSHRWKGEWLYHHTIRGLECPPNLSISTIPNYVKCRRAKDPQSRTYWKKLLRNKLKV